MKAELYSFKTHKGKEEEKCKGVKKVVEGFKSCGSQIPHKLPEGQLADKQLQRFLMETDFPKCNCPWSVRLRFLRATHSGSAFAGCLSG